MGDLKMPHTSGMALHAWLCEHLPAMAPRMIFITGASNDPKAREFLGQVDNPWLDKPFDIEQLRSLIAKLVR